LQKFEFLFTLCILLKAKKSVLIICGVSSKSELFGHH